ncbi:trypsin-like serine protease [bacterium]|nr:MAG: trypsin-like serine protease [bacterium]
MEPLAVRLLVYKACLAAVWSDDAMSAEERKHLASLIEQLAEGEEERAVFRQHSLAELTPHLVLEQVAALPEPERRAVFERCLAVLAADKRLDSSDRRFLWELRAACGVGRVDTWRRLWALRGEGVRLFGPRAVARALLLSLVALWALSPGRVAPKALPSGREVRIRTPDAAPEAAGAGLQPELVYRFVEASFATVEVLVDGQRRFGGSASVLGDDEAGELYLLTNRHVVKQRVSKGSTLTFRVRFPKDEVRPAVLDFMSKDKDLAVLRVAAPAGDHPALTLRPRAGLAVGQRVYALGSPHGLEATLTGGLISALREKSLQTDATVDHGSSGGPLLDAEGRLCGVVTEGNAKKNYSFAIYADAVLEALAERRGKR